jgi:hypothetical protein
MYEKNLEGVKRQCSILADGPEVTLTPDVNSGHENIPHAAARLA